MVHKLNRFVLCLLLLSLTFAATVHRAHAEVNDDYALKISLENQLERKLKQVIMEITGTDRVVIFVNAELASARGDSDKLLEKKKTNALVLPGVPEKKEFGAGQSEMLFGAGSSKYKVNKIVLSIWIDKSVPGSIATLIEDIAKNVIGYNQNRGDQINIKKVDFESKGFYWSSLFFPPNLFWLLLTIIGGFMLVAVGMFFMDPLKKIAPALKDIDWNHIRGGASSTSVNVNTVERTSSYEREVLSGKADRSGAGAPAADQSLPFSFIRERDIQSLAFLMKDKTPQDIAVVANYLDPAIAMRLLELFPKERQVEVALALGKEEINTEKVAALEEMVKSKLAYVVGGESKAGHAARYDERRRPRQDRKNTRDERRPDRDAPETESEEPGEHHPGSARAGRSDAVPEHRRHALCPGFEIPSCRDPAESHYLPERRSIGTAQGRNGPQSSSLSDAAAPGEAECDGSGKAADQRRTRGG